MKMMKMKRISKKNEPIRENILKNVEEYKNRIDEDYACRKITALMGADAITEMRINNLIRSELRYFNLLLEEIKFEWDDYDFVKYNVAFADTVSHEIRMKNVANLIKWSYCATFEHFEE